MPFPKDDRGMVKHEFTAFMEDPDADKPNPIHSTKTAREHGFRGALVGGATAFGWTARTIVAALGSRWLDEGWVHLKFVNPIYPDDALRFEVAGSEFTSGRHELEFAKKRSRKALDPGLVIV